MASVFAFVSSGFYRVDSGRLLDIYVSEVWGVGMWVFCTEVARGEVNMWEVFGASVD